MDGVGDRDLKINSNWSGKIQLTPRNPLLFSPHPSLSSSPTLFLVFLSFFLLEIKSDFERKKEQWETVGKGEERKWTFNFFSVLHGNLICNHPISYSTERSCTRKISFHADRWNLSIQTICSYILVLHLKKTESIDFRFFYLRKNLFQLRAPHWRSSSIPIDKSSLEMELKLAPLKKKLIHLEMDESDLIGWTCPFTSLSLTYHLINLSQMQSCWQCQR